MKNYLAITIGPIVETLLESKATKEIFAGSYLFSYLMKNFVLKLKEKGFELLVPFHSEMEKIAQEKNGIGMYHDRIIATATNEIDVNTVQEIIDAQLNSLAEKIVAIDSKNNEKHKSEILEFFKQYFQISFVITSESSILKLNSMLDSCELHRTFLRKPQKYNLLFDQEGKKANPLLYLQRKFHNSFLREDAFEAKQDFPSLLEIALRKNIDYHSVNFEKEGSLELERLALKGVKNHSKYIAIIYADGDKVGKVLEKIDASKNTIAIQSFSKLLLDFTKKVPTIAKKYEASVVYSGGDDIVAFAPLLNQNGTVFDLLKELDSEFKMTMEGLYEAKAEVKDVSLSFGVAIAYYKRPLYDVIEKSRNNLFGIAKNQKERNYLSLELIKHSGQTTNALFKLNTEIYKLFNDLLAFELDNELTGLPHAVSHNIDRSYATIRAIANMDDFKDLLDNFFANNFNKEVHAKERAENSLSILKELLKEFIASYKMRDISKENKEEDSFKNYFEGYKNLLSIIKHLRGDR